MRRALDSRAQLKCRFKNTFAGIADSNDREELNIVTLCKIASKCECNIQASLEMRGIDPRASFCFKYNILFISGLFSCQLLILTQELDFVDLFVIVRYDMINRWQ